MSDWPAFNAGLCARVVVPPLDHDGRHDALLHAYSGDGARYIEHVADHGSFTDLPLATVMSALRKADPQFS